MVSKTCCPVYFLLIFWMLRFSFFFVMQILGKVKCRYWFLELFKALVLQGTWYGFCEDLCALEISSSWIYLHVLFTSQLGIYSCSCWYGHLILVFFYLVSYGVLQLQILFVKCSKVKSLVFQTHFRLCSINGEICESKSMTTTPLLTLSSSMICLVSCLSPSL